MKNVACIDLEGVLAPEMWPHIGLVTGIPGLSVTTREVRDYSTLMQQRIALLQQHGLTLPDVQKVVATLPVLDGAAEFLKALRKNYRVLIISDAFEELALHFIGLLGRPEFQCHRFSTTKKGAIHACRFFPRQGKEETVRSLQSDGYHTLAVGDAFNDLAMLRTADIGFLFRPSQQTLMAASDLRVTDSYDEILLAAEQAFSA